jgi:epoxyqueuosine reductase QueG
MLDRFAIQAAVALELSGAKALAVPASQITAWRPLPRGHISHKLLGAAAGLGWRGRNNLLVTPRHGARIRLVSVLTDLPVEAANSPLEFGCGSCRECIELCPAGAIKQDPHDFDAQACSEKLAEFSKIRFIGQRICGICVKACKPTTNRK